MEDNTMSNEELEAQQREALQSLIDYSPKLINGIKISAGELDGKRVEDTDEFLRKVVDGINWVLSVLNGCMSLINRDEILINKETANAAIVRFDETFKSGLDSQIAQSLTNDILPLINLIAQTAEKFK